MNLISALKKSNMAEATRILDSYPNEIFCCDTQNRIALHYAAEKADPETFKRILEMDHSLIHCQDQNGYTPLFIATMSGNIQAIELLIKNDIQINHVDKEKHSAVHWAVACGQLEALATLLANGAKVNCVDNQGAQAIHYLAAAQDISAECCEVMLNVLLKHGAKVNSRDIDGRTPVLWAASYGNLEMLIILLQTGGDICAVDRDQLGAIHCAASHGHVHIIEYLINTLDQAIVNSVDRNGDTALFYAVTMGHYECSRLLLLNGADVNRQDHQLRCAIHCAAAKGQLRMLKLLKHFGGSCEIQNRRGDLPVHEAIQAGAKDCVEYLLALYPSSINVSNHDGRTGLHLAAAAGNLEMVILLCSRNTIINPLMLYKDTLFTPLDLAMQKNHEKVVEYLLLQQDAKLAEELSDETLMQTRLQIEHRILEVNEDKQKNYIKSHGMINKSSGKLTTENAENTEKIESISQETQTAIQDYRAVATNTSRPVSRDSANIGRIHRCNSFAQKLLPKATSTGDLKQYLSEEHLKNSSGSLKNVCTENTTVGEVNNDHWCYRNYWTSEEDEISDDERKNTGKSSRNILKKSQNKHGIQGKQIIGSNWLYGKNEADEKRMKKKIMELAESDDNSSQGNHSDSYRQKTDSKPEMSNIHSMNNDFAQSERSIAVMNNKTNKNQCEKKLKCTKYEDKRMPKCAAYEVQRKPNCAEYENNFGKELTKSIGSSHIDIYRTEFGEITMEQQFNKSNRIGRCNVKEEVIFNELTRLKKMQLQYGKVKEQILVRSLINSFCKMHNFNPAHFKFDTFHAWEKFLCDQLKLIYLEERNRILNTRHPRSISTNKYERCQQQKNSSQIVLHTGIKRCNCLYNKTDLF